MIEEGDDFLLNGTILFVTFDEDVGIIITSMLNDNESQRFVEVKLVFEKFWHSKSLHL